MLNDQYLTMNPRIGNNILSTYFGNHGSSYASNDNIPNPWTMILNPYYLSNPPLMFSHTTKFVAFPFLNMVPTIIVATRGSQGVQMSMMTPLIIVPIGEFSIQNPMPYFQPPTQNSPSRFGDYKDGKPMGDGSSPPHGSGRPPRGGNKPSRRGNGPLSKGGPPSGGGPLSGRRPPKESGGGFLARSTRVPFGAP
jgi:hypothetical protein